MQFIPHSPIRQLLVPCPVCLSDSSVDGATDQATSSNVLFIKNEINISVVDEKRNEKEDTDGTKHFQSPKYFIPIQNPVIGLVLELSQFGCVDE